MAILDNHKTSMTDAAYKELAEAVGKLYTRGDSGKGCCRWLDAFTHVRDGRQPSMHGLVNSGDMHFC
jgi:hypothetical protein